MVSGYAAALPVWFNARTQKEARLAPSETDQPRFLYCQGALPARFNTINTRRCVDLFVTLGFAHEKPTHRAKHVGILRYFRPSAILQSTSSVFLVASSWAHMRDAISSFASCTARLVFTPTMLGARPHLGAILFKPEDAYPCF